MIKIVRNYFHGGLFMIVLVIVLGIAESVTGTFASSAFSKLLGSLGGSRDQVTYFALIYLVLTIVSDIFFGRGIDFLTAVQREKSVTNLRTAVDTKLHQLPVADLTEISIPDAVASGYEIPELVGSICWLPKLVASMLTSSIVSVVIFLATDAKLTAIIIAACLPFVLIILHTRKSMGELAVKKRKYDGQLSEALSRARCFTVIKGFVKESFEIERFQKIHKKFSKISLKKRYLHNKLGFVVVMMFTTMEFIIILYSILCNKSVTEAVLFDSLLNRILNPIIDLPDTMDRISAMLAKVSKIRKLIDMKDEVDGDVNLDSFEDSIEFRNVSFSYDGSRNTLTNIDLKIQKGEKIGIYGPSGGGKSTFVNLIPRYYHVTSGSILVDGIDIERLTKASLRKKIGIVSQNIYLFSNSTIRENIMYGNIHATEADMVNAAKKANAYDFIMSFPDGFDSVVGNDGVKLSGGEQQRISIARLFLANPEILILDEATSKLDNQSEKLVQDAIDRLGADKTIISIAHRLSTIANCDRLIGINSHKIFEQGTPEELLENKESLFYKLSNQ